MELTKGQLINACISFQYNYELLSPGKQRVLKDKASRWFKAFQNSVIPIYHDEKIQVEEEGKRNNMEQRILYEGPRQSFPRR